MWNRNAKIDFSCPNCRKRFEISVGKILDGVKFSCAKCRIPINATDLQRRLKSIERQIDRFKAKNPNNTINLS